MTIERLKEAAELEKKLLTFYEEGLYGWNGCTAQIQMEHKPFFEMFPDAEIEPRGAETHYPWGAHAELDGVKFYCIMSQEEYEGTRPVPAREQDPTELIEEEQREREKQWWANYEADAYGGTDDEEF